MTTKAIAVTTRQMAGVVLDGTTRRVIPLSEYELYLVKSELARINGKRRIRPLAGRRRAVTELAIKYSTEPVGRVYGAFLGVYGLVCLVVAKFYTQVAKISRWRWAR